MIRVNVYEAKAKLSEYLDRAARGERIIICRHNRPVAELRPVTEGRSEPRPIGPIPGRPTFDIAKTFFEPLADSDLAAWEQLTPSDPLSDGWRSPSRATSKASDAVVTPIRRTKAARRPQAGRRRS